MLFSKLFTPRFYFFSQNGFYLDFIAKKIGELFIRNFLIYSFQFFGEKYLIEFFTKYIFINFFMKLTKVGLKLNYNFEVFFYNLIINFFFIFSFFQIFILLF